PRESPKVADVPELPSREDVQPPGAGTRCWPRHTQGALMSQRKLFHDSVVELPRETGVTPTGMKINARGPEHSDEKRTVSFSLSPDAAVNDQLEAIVARAEVVPVEDLQTKYGVTEQAVAPLLAWLKKEGFEIVHVAAD